METENRVLLITGAGGHLGKALLHLLAGSGLPVRGLLHHEEEKKEVEDIDPDASFFVGDIKEKESLSPFFANLEGKEAYLIHAASLVDIQHETLQEPLRLANVVGTENVLSLAKEAGVKASVYVSSVDSFAAKRIVANEESAWVEEKRAGGYAISKAMANRVVLEYRKKGMDVRIAYPSGFFGPYDEGSNHLNQVVIDFLNGKIPGVVKQGYAIADARDIAQGVWKALFEAPKNSSYILSGHYVSLADFVAEAAKAYGVKKKIRTFPIFLGKVGVPFVKLHGKIHHERPLYTLFSLNLLRDANRFDDGKARKELGYTSRPLEETMKDAVAYFEEKGLLKNKKKAGQ